MEVYRLVSFSLYLAYLKSSMSQTKVCVGGGVMYVSVCVSDIPPPPPPNAFILFNQIGRTWVVVGFGVKASCRDPSPEPADMSGPEVAKTPGGGGPGKEGKEPVANGHGEGDSNPFAEYMWMENEEEYNRQVSVQVLAVHRVRSVGRGACI